MALGQIALHCIIFLWLCIIACVFRLLADVAAPDRGGPLP